MNQLNSVILEGNLVRDPEGKLTQSGRSVCNFTMGCNRSYKQDGVRHKEVSYFDVEVWAKVAESCEKHLRKGRGVRVVGRLKQDHWVDDKGNGHNKVKIVGEHVEFQSSKIAAEGKSELQDGLDSAEDYQIDPASGEVAEELDV